MQTAKALDYYRRLPYTMYVEPMTDSDSSCYWVAEYRELRGCKTDGETESVAISNLQNLFDEYIEARIEAGVGIPEPEQSPCTVREVWIIVPEQKQVSHVQTAIDYDVQESRETRIGIQSETNSVDYNDLVAA